MKTILLLLAASACALALSACGNKGPLVMPQKSVPVEAPSAPPPVDAQDMPAPADQPPAVKDTANPPH